MNETVISWTVTNWVTVFLMVFLGSIIAGAILATVKSVQKKASANG
jgi:hypothetical protein